MPTVFWKTRPPNITNLLSSMLKISVSDNFFDRIRVVFYKIRTVSFNNKVFVSTFVIPFDETQLDQENCSMTEHHLHSGSWILRYGLIYYLYSWEAIEGSLHHDFEWLSTEQNLFLPITKDWYLYSPFVYEKKCVLAKSYIL